MQITKAVITAAGRGARQYPASDTVQKAMLPLVDRDGLTKPVLQIIAEEASRAESRRSGSSPHPATKPFIATTFAITPRISARPTGASSGLKNKPND